MKNKRPFIGVGIIVKRGGKILLLKRKGSHGQGQWALPGGYLEFGESLRQCAVREIKEETGLKVKERDLRFVSLSEQFDYIKSDGKHCLTAGFSVEYQGKKQPQVCEANKSTEISWFDLKKLPKPLFTPSKDNIINFKKKRVFK
jgi:8-oxo-dGTP diphosphatase